MDKDNQINEPFTEYSQPVNFDQVWQLFLETDKQFKETDRKFQETDKKIKELTALFTSQWGKLVEALVEGDLIKLLRTKNIKVERTFTKNKRKS